MRGRSISHRLRKAGTRSALASILALSVPLATPGCSMMVLDRYRDGAMAEVLYFRAESHEQPEIIVSWSHREGNPGGLQPKPLLNLLVIRPELDGCPFIEVYLNEVDRRLSRTIESAPAMAIPAEGPLIPDETYPDCSVLLTFATSGEPPRFVMAAATKKGVVAEFPDGKRKPAWLLLLPFTAVCDTAGLALIGGLVGGGALARAGTAVPMPPP